MSGVASHSPACLSSQELLSELESQTSDSPDLLSEQGLKLTWSLGEMWFKQPLKILNSLPTLKNQAISFDVVNVLSKR